MTMGYEVRQNQKKAWAWMSDNVIFCKYSATVIADRTTQLSFQRMDNLISLGHFNSSTLGTLPSAFAVWLVGHVPWLSPFED